jgi:hypothetical protein
MKTIHKYTLKINDNKQVFNILGSAKLISIQRQGDELVMWWFGTTLTSDRRAFRIYDTGHEVTDWNAEPLGTVQFGSLVWHVFEIEE